MIVFNCSCFGLLRPGNFENLCESIGSSLKDMIHSTKQGEQEKQSSEGWLKLGSVGLLSHIEAFWSPF